MSTPSSFCKRIDLECPPCINSGGELAGMFHDWNFVCMYVCMSAAVFDLWKHYWTIVCGWTVALTLYIHTYIYTYIYIHTYIHIYIHTYRSTRQAYAYVMTNDKNISITAAAEQRLTYLETFSALGSGAYLLTYLLIYTYVIHTYLHTYIARTLMDPQPFKYTYIARKLHVHIRACRRILRINLYHD